MLEAPVLPSISSLIVNQVKLTIQKPIFHIRAGEDNLDLQLMFLQPVLHVLQSA
jgi:hypothetical protein